MGLDVIFTIKVLNNKLLTLDRFKTGHFDEFDSFV